jgi:hypothetical protein
MVLLLGRSDRRLTDCAELSGDKNFFRRDVMLMQDWNNADLAIIGIVVLGVVSSVAMLVFGSNLALWLDKRIRSCSLEAVITGCVTAVAGIARGDKIKGIQDKNTEPFSNTERNTLQ